MSAVVALLVGGMVWLLVPSQGRGLERLRQRAPRAMKRWVRLGLIAVAGVMGLALVNAALGPDVALWVVIASLVAGLARWVVLRGRARQARVTRQREVAEACQVVAGQLRIGQIPSRALTAAAEDCAVVEPVAAAQLAGASVPEALRAAAERPGGSGLASLAAAWQVSSQLGAPVASMAVAVADGLRDEERLRQTVATELAATRASGKVLAALPLLGIGLAALVGADPATFLLTTWPGRVCVLAAVALTCAGLVWTESLADQAGGGLT